VVLLKPCWDGVLNEIKQTPQMFVYLTVFYNCSWSTLISLVWFPAEPSFLLHTENGKTRPSCHSIFQWAIFSLTQCHGIVNEIFSFFFRLKHPDVKSLMLIGLISVRMTRSGFSSPAICYPRNTLFCLPLAIDQPAPPAISYPGQQYATVHFPASSCPGNK